MAVVELLCFESLQADLASSALAEELAPLVTSRYRSLTLSA